MATSVARHASRCLRHTRLARHMSSVKGYQAVNEPILEYRPGSPESKELEEAIRRYEGKVVDIPIVIGDEEIRLDQVRSQVRPFDHQKKVATFCYATPELVTKAVESSLKARKDWEKRPQEERSRIFLDAADLMAKKYRMDLMAATMLGQAKNIVQAEIDAAAELVDFLRFNVMFAQKVTEYQPISPDNVITNTMSYRGMEGFWAAITPFNFTAIGGHLPMAPALMGNVCLWKPSDTAMLSNYLVYKVYREAGLPAGVINFLPADGPVFGNTILASPDLCGINFTGSVRTFKTLWKQVADNLDIYRTYPRLIGECGGKNMHFVHKSADVQSVVNGTLLSAFEFNGQKCSACSRLYVPQSMWPKVKDGLLAALKEVKVGSPLDRQNLVTAVIDDKAFDRNKSFLDKAKSDPSMTIVAGGTCDNSQGYFVQPTIVETSDPSCVLMQEEIFGPVLTVYPYPDEQFLQTAEVANQTSPFGLTGAIYVQDGAAREQLCAMFRDAAGNFYINDKSTGSVVGQQPFGGARLSGTNDKAGGPHYLTKFISQQAIKERSKPMTTWKYPSMETQ
ncbi:delta-1-pyrroline-5-carboxylate dehydrogenase, mitochondrial-like [Babylonia areolata]|uniref:delta-1-pyrroline-5-carboxylate dehydrogenase, mitochondrial-like n=1 Tax=Babylonia areolata TaxID=304850 RepID=UPI003FD3D5B0